MMIVRAKNVLIPIFIAIICFFISFYIVDSVLFVAVMSFWTLLLMYSAASIRSNPLLFCFSVAFFVFLLGRQFCFHYLNEEQVYGFLNVTNDKTYICLLFSLIGILIGVLISKRTRFFFSPEGSKPLRLDISKSREYQFACGLLYYICFFGSVAATLMQIQFVMRVGYLASYVQDSGGAGIPTIISYLSKFALVALCLYIGTKPRRKNTLVALFCYEIHAVLTLLTGQRYPFVGTSMLLYTYILIRSNVESGWVKKHYGVFLIVSIPMLMIFLSAYDSIRLGTSFQMNSFVGGLKDFLIQQGGSINVIRRTIFNAEQLNDMKFVSFQSIYSSLFENGISRRLFDIKVYSGNSIERALNTNNLAHRLSLYAYGDGYLQGRGTGSSFVAELLHDFGVTGVFFGSLVYGLIIAKIDKIRFRNPVFDGLRLAMIYQFILSPRGSFDSFIGNVFTLQSVMGIFAIMMISYLLKSFGINRKLRFLESTGS